MADFAGNSATQARRLALSSQPGAKPSVVRDRLDSSNRNDFYQVSLRQRSSLNLRVDGIGVGADVNLELRNSDNQVIGRSTNAGQLRETLKQVLDTGKYFIRVFRKSGDTDYRLKASVAPPPDLAGNTTATARQISVSGNPSVSSDFVSVTSDDSDYYAFTLTDKTTRLQSSISGVTANAQVNLFDSANHLITSNNSNSTPDFEQILGAGTYYAQVKPLIGATTYNLSLTGIPIADTAGETAATARQVSLGAKSTRLEDFVGAGDADDYYTFTVPKTAAQKTTTLNGSIATKPGMPGDSSLLRVSLIGLNAKGAEMMQASYQSSIDPTFSYKNLTPGTYYVRVSQIQNAQATYQLDLSIA